jgi:hypothetical protein
MAECPVQVCSEPAVYRPRTRGCLRMLRGEWKGSAGRMPKSSADVASQWKNSPLKVCALFMTPSQYRLLTLD